MTIRNWIKLLAIVSIPYPLSPIPCQQWVDVDHREPLTAGRTTDDVKRDALHAALAEAVRRVVGVHVQGSELAVRAESAGKIVDHYNQVVRLDAAGRATDWKVLREQWSTAKRGAPGAAVTYELSLRVKVEREPGDRDPGFSLRIETNATRLTVRSAEPRDNDELVARVTATKHAFLTLVLIADDSVFVLAPNDFLKTPDVGEGQTVELPSADLRSAGLRFRSSLPAGVEARSELLAVIGTVTPVPPFARFGRGSARDTGVLTLAEFNQWLVGIPMGDRAVAQVGLEVRRNR